MIRIQLTLRQNR